MNGINGAVNVVPLYWAQSKDGAWASDIISLKNFLRADICLMVGAVTKAAAVTLEQGTSVSSAATALSFERYYKTGFVLKYDGASTGTPAAAGETVTGAGAGSGTILYDLGDKVVGYAFNGTTFVDNEVLTFSGGKTAVANGIQINEDILVPLTAASNTFNIEATANRMYVIPVEASMLTDGYDCVELNVADADTTLFAAWAILYPRYSNEIPETAIYD